jgi:diaminohydroxyphosphoribosylaminopyrimidine deaminase / 5-amino-6-(5-phosphoribosylamino)uracil reductase
VNSLDRLYLERACELAQRGMGNTSPNPAVGAVIVHDGEIAGEGYHHRAGEPHAEVNALHAAGDRARGATIYVSLEPCDHHGRTPPCSQALIDAGIARVVIGAEDPNPKTDGAGIRRLRDRGIAVEVANDAQASAIIEPFARAIRAHRPYISLKMAMSLDGFIASKPGGQEWLTGDQAREFVRELRIEHDAVAVGAGTIRVDNPQLTVRPAHFRLREYVRVVVCETDAVDPASAVFAPETGYGQTIVLAPAGAAPRFAQLRGVADVLFVGAANEMDLDMGAGMQALRERGISSVLCEGGPTMAGHLLAAGLVDRFHWLIAPRLLRTESSVPVVTAGALSERRGLRFDRVERLGRDLLVSGIIDDRV